MRPIGIRTRLTALYSLVLALSLCAFGAIAYLAMGHSIRATVYAGLRQRLDGVRAIIAEDAPAGRAALEDELREFANGIGPRGRLLITDADGNVIFASPGMEHPASRATQRKARPTYREDIDGMRFRVLEETVEVSGARYHVAVATSTADLDWALRRFRLVLLLAVPICLVLAGAGGYWMSRRALAPVDEITRAARSIGAQDLSKRLGAPRTGDELQRLADTLNEMLGRLQGAFEQITQFTADASHELRSPISVMRTNAEVTLRKPRSEEEYREALSQILWEAEKVSQLIEQLLFLARVDAGPAKLPMVRTDLAEIVKSSCQQARPRVEAKHLEFCEDVAACPTWIQGDAPSLERLFLILLDNAVKYTPAGGRIEVRLAAENGLVVASIRDTGIGISVGDIPRIFDRFYRADRARSRESGGTGLGLAIGRWIVEAHRGEIRVESEVSKGSSFQVRIPLLQR